MHDKDYHHFVRIKQISFAQKERDTKDYIEEGNDHRYSRRTKAYKKGETWKILSFGNGQHRKTDIIMGRQCLKKHLPPYEKNLIFYKKKKKKRHWRPLKGNEKVIWWKGSRWKDIFQPHYKRKLTNLQGYFWIEIEMFYKCSNLLFSISLCLPLLSFSYIS